MADPILNIDKVLEGKINLVKVPATITNYYFKVATQTLTGTTDKISVMNIEEVYINCDTTLGDIYIHLPSIADFSGFWNAKVYVTNKGANNVYVLSYSDEIINNLISGVSSTTLTPTQANYYHIVSDNNWSVFVCPPFVAP